MRGRQNGEEVCAKDNWSYVVDVDGQPLYRNGRFLKPTKVGPSPHGETEEVIKTPEMEVPKTQQPSPVQSEGQEPVQKGLPLPVECSHGTVPQLELNSSQVDASTTVEFTGGPDRIQTSPCHPRDQLRYPVQPLLHAIWENCPQTLQIY